MKQSEGKKHRGKEPGHGRGPREDEKLSAALDAGKHPGEKERPGDELSVLREKAARADEYYERLLRLKAEFENFRKRTLREKAEWELHANRELMLQLLPVLDSFELGLGAAKKTRDFDKLLEGFELTLGELFNVLGKLGLKEVKAAGREFDPEYHEAVMLVESDSHHDDTVVDEIRKGYLLHNKLLRPAIVTVARAKRRLSPGDGGEAGGTCRKKGQGQEG